jgi:beta-lactamase superfamily II metal-dependent hydrolase
MIQVDMFEVQLGASLLLHFTAAEGETVRVLADAGQGPPVSDVHQKLMNAFMTFGDGEQRIDLLVGTHYDADHLDGLIPIIKDTTIAITESWLPPIANDSEQHAFDEPLTNRHFLPNQFYSLSGREVLRRYLDAKRRVCEQLRPSSAW